MNFSSRSVRLIFWLLCVRRSFSCTILVFLLGGVTAFCCDSIIVLWVSRWNTGIRCCDRKRLPPVIFVIMNKLRLHGKYVVFNEFLWRLRSLLFYSLGKLYFHCICGIDSVVVSGGIKLGHSSVPPKISKKRLGRLIILSLFINFSPFLRE